MFHRFQGFKELSFEFQVSSFKTNVPALEFHAAREMLRA
jgi:hypothetical protein